SASAAADDIRTGGQPEDRAATWPHRSAVDPLPRRRGDRMRRVVAALALWLCAIIPALAQNAENLPIVRILRINTADTVSPAATPPGTAPATPSSTRSAWNS